MECEQFQFESDCIPCEETFKAVVIPADSSLSEYVVQIRKDAWWRDRQLI